jgi:hypothetical protein
MPADVPLSSKERKALESVGGLLEDLAAIGQKDHSHILAKALEEEPHTSTNADQWSDDNILIPTRLELRRLELRGKRLEAERTDAEMFIAGKSSSLSSSILAL